MGSKYRHFDRKNRLYTFFPIVLIGYIGADRDSIQKMPDLKFDLLFVFLIEISVFLFLFYRYLCSHNILIFRW